MAKTKVPVTIEQRMNLITELQALGDVPWAVKRTGINPQLHGDNISFTTDGDYITLSEAQELVVFLAKQLGVKVVE